MTVITLTAVGYDEVHPLSPPGRAFTSFILFGGITGLGLWFAFLTSFIVELDLAKRFPQATDPKTGQEDEKPRHCLRSRPNREAR